MSSVLGKITFSIYKELYWYARYSQDPTNKDLSYNYRKNLSHARTDVKQPPILNLIKTLQQYHYIGNLKVLSNKGLEVVMVHIMELLEALEELENASFDRIHYKGVKVARITRYKNDVKIFLSNVKDAEKDPARINLNGAFTQPEGLLLLLFAITKNIYAELYWYTLYRKKPKNKNVAQSYERFLDSSTTREESLRTIADGLTRVLKSIANLSRDEIDEIMLGIKDLLEALEHLEKASLDIKHYKGLSFAEINRCKQLVKQIEGNFVESESDPKHNTFMVIKPLILSGHILLQLFSKVINLLRKKNKFIPAIVPFLFLCAFGVLETLIAVLQSFIPATLAQIWANELY